MIYYNPMTEQWEDDEDPKWSVSMTPEGDSEEELEQSFNTREDFYKYYEGQ